MTRHDPCGFSPVAYQAHPGVHETLDPRVQATCGASCTLAHRPRTPKDRGAGVAAGPSKPTERLLVSIGVHHPRHVGHATAATAAAILLRNLGHDGLGG